MMAAMLELRPPLPEDADPLWRIAREGAAPRS
jgi:hypothetical protein